MTRLTTTSLTHAATLAAILTSEGFTALWWVQGKTGCIVTNAPEHVVTSCVNLVNMGGV